jgi:hypothetical protein
MFFGNAAPTQSQSSYRAGDNGAYEDQQAAMHNQLSGFML